MKKIVGTVVAVCALMLAGCVNNDPFGTANDPDTITIGSQDYYSNEIIAEIYAQALEKRGHKVKRELRIGQREAYLPEIESGSIDLFPEYTGPLLQYWKKQLIRLILIIKTQLENMMKMVFLSGMDMEELMSIKLLK